MDNNYILVEHESSVKNVLMQTFQSMQRIKLTCFDVSQHYIVFGANSGGIYIFGREPCQFIKLIPSKEGSATNISISPDEKKIAISTSKGFILILDNILDVNNYEVYSEHDGQAVTALKWHNTDLFAGDQTGKVSVISGTNILAKAIFQSSSASLMNLDSGIVQIDCYSKYLLVTTRSRAYFCDTERQQYRQIGKKLRDGLFGGCFFNVPSTDDLVIQTQNGYLFQSIRDDELFVTTSTDVKIYCARPGARLWEVSHQAVVLQTHQFRMSFIKPPSDIIQIKNHENARLDIIKHAEPKTVPEDFNFGKLINIYNKFILTYDKNGIYIFDPSISQLSHWISSKNIKDVRQINSFLYVWRENLQFDVFSLEELEKVLLKTLTKKQYYLCTDLCIQFNSQILNLIDTSNKLYLLSSLRSKLDEKELLEKIEPILNKIKELNNHTIKNRKLTNGIVMVENAYSNIPESVEFFEPKTQDINKQIYIMLKQYKLHETHKNIDIPDFCKLFESKNVLETIKKFVSYAKEELCLDVETWCQEQTLKQFSKQDLLMDEELTEYLKKAFVAINGDSPDLRCKCGYPLPKAHLQRPKYYKLALKLFTDDFPPSMYRKKLENLKNPGLHLPLLIQYSDEEILKKYLNKFTYDTWDEVIKTLIKLNRGICLNCDEKIDLENILQWTNVGLLMIQSIGGANCNKLLKRYAHFIDNGQLDHKFYRACIFSVVAEPHLNKNGVNFMDEILNSNSSCEFEKQMMIYLKNKHLGKYSMLNNSSSSLPNCSYCSLPMNTPMINDPSRLPCGHVFHTICLKHNNGICHVCNIDLV